MTPTQSIKIALSLITLGVLLGALSACANSNSNANSNTNSNAPQNAQFDKTMNSHTLTALDLSQIGIARTMATFDDKLLIVNDKNELWQMSDDKPLSYNVSDVVAPMAGFDKIAFADKDGFFTLWQNGKIYPSQIRLSPHSTMLVLPLAVIAVIDDNGTPSLVRLEIVNETPKIVAKFAPVLPDARPVQVNFTGDNTDGHIAVLSHPDSTTYQHGVLGDDIEAGQLQFLERHSLTPLARPLATDGQVFEANTVAILPHDKGNRLVATMAGGGNGARVVVIDNVKDKLTIIAQSTPLPNNRWQSPFVLNGKLYAVQMPHLIGKLVQYQKNQGTLIEKVLGDGYSNHAIGDFETNLAVSTDNFAIIPKAGYRTAGLLDNVGNLTTLDELPAHIIKSTNTKNPSTPQTVYLLLDNGQIWVRQ